MFYHRTLISIEFYSSDWRIWHETVRHFNHNHPYCLDCPVFAQTVDITLTDNGNGSFTIGYTNATEDLSGVSMRVTLSGGDAVLAGCGDAVANDPPFNTHIDYWNTTGGTTVLGVRVGSVD